MPVIVNRLSGLKAEAEARYARNLQAAGEFYVDKLERALSHLGFGSHSAPGQIPYRQSGFLMNSFYVRVSNMRMSVKSICPYAVFLTNGTARMAPRPFGAPVWKANEAAIRAIILRK